MEGISILKHFFNKLRGRFKGKNDLDELQLELFLTEEAKLNIQYCFDMIAYLETKLKEASHLKCEDKALFKTDFDAEFAVFMEYMFGDNASIVNDLLDNRSGNQHGDSSKH